jgi:hypothetical protein
VPVRVTGLSINEETYDTALNPIRARVNASLRVLSYSDLELTNPGYSIFLTYQIVREAMATLGSVSNLSRALGSDLSVW